MARPKTSSTNVVVNQDDTPSSYQYYYPFGGHRGGLFSPLTTKRYTGQYHEADLPGGEGLNYYGTRWYDAQLGRFIVTDVHEETDRPQSLNRFSYV
jgi:RHS repeat-associated protein